MDYIKAELLIEIGWTGICSVVCIAVHVFGWRFLWWFHALLKGFYMYVCVLTFVSCRTFGWPYLYLQQPGDGGFFLTCEDLGRMFDHPLLACIFSFSFLPTEHCYPVLCFSVWITGCNRLFFFLRQSEELAQFSWISHCLWTFSSHSQECMGLTCSLLSSKELYVAAILADKWQHWTWSFDPRQQRWPMLHCGFRWSFTVQLNYADRIKILLKNTFCPEMKVDTCTSEL